MMPLPPLVGLASPDGDQDGLDDGTPPLSPSGWRCIKHSCSLHG